MSDETPPPDVTPPVVTLAPISDEITQACMDFDQLAHRYRTLAAMGNRDAQAHLADRALEIATAAGDGTLIADALWWSQLAAEHNLRIDVFRLVQTYLLYSAVLSKVGNSVFADQQRNNALILLNMMAEAGDEEAGRHARIVAAEALQDSPMILASMEMAGSA